MAHRVTLIPGDGTGPRADRGDPPRPRGDRRRVRLGRPARRHRRDGGERRQPAAPGHARLDPRERRRPQGPDHDSGRRRLPLRQRRPAQGARHVRAGAAVQVVRGRAHPLRRRRPDHRPREHRGPLRRHRVRAGHARRRGADPLDRVEGRQAALARRGHLDQADLRHRHAADLRVRLRLRAPQRPPQDHGRPQGEHHEVLGRALAARRARGRRREHGHRVRRPDRGQHVHAARPAAGGVRRARPPEPLRRRPLRSVRRDDRRPRDGARRELRRARGGLRAHPRLRPEVHGPEQGQPDGADALGDADAAPSRRDRGRRPPGDGDRRRDPRGQEPDLRHEADPRRPDRSRDERGRRRDHRQAGSRV